jgi:hypothetical protein
VTWKSPFKSIEDERLRRVFDSLELALRVPHVEQTRTEITVNRDWVSATPAAIPTNPCQVEITKHFDDTKLLCTIELPRMVPVGGGCSLQAHARVNGVNYEAIDYAPMAVGGYYSITGSVLIDGLEAGEKTVEIYGARDANTARIEGGTTVCLTVTETY